MAQVYDKDGEWFVNRALFRFAHGTREGVVFDPQVPTRVKKDAWIDGQELIVPVEDPFGDLPTPINAVTPLDGGQSAEAIAAEAETLAKAAAAKVVAPVPTSAPAQNSNRR